MLTCRFTVVTVVYSTQRFYKSLFGRFTEAQLSVSQQRTRGFLQKLTWRTQCSFIGGLKKLTQQFYISLLQPLLGGLTVAYSADLQSLTWRIQYSLQYLADLSCRYRYLLGGFTVAANPQLLGTLAFSKFAALSRAGTVYRKRICVIYRDNLRKYFVHTCSGFNLCSPTVVGKSSRVCTQGAVILTFFTF